MAFRITVSVKPQAKEERIARISAQEYKVFVNAAPVDGKANEAVIKLLAQYFAVPKSSVRVIRGAASRRKLIEIG